MQTLWFKDFHNRNIRLTYERQKHIEEEHPEMSGQIQKMQEALLEPEIITLSRTDPEVQIFYRHYKTTPVTEKYLSVLVKVHEHDLFIITAYFTDTVKRGEILWKKK